MKTKRHTINYNTLKRSCLLLLLFCISYKAQSQTDSSFFLNRTEFKVGYYGNLAWNNGLNTGAEYAWKERKKVKEKKHKHKTVTHQLLFNGSIGLSTNFTNQTENSFHTYYGLIWRRTGPKRWQLNVELNPLGYYRSILPETFEVQGNEVSNVKFPGRSYYAPTMAIGLGRQRKDKRVSGWYFNLNFGIRAPYNAGTLPMITLQYGYRFNFKKK